MFLRRWTSRVPFSCASSKRQSLGVWLAASYSSSRQGDFLSSLTFLGRLTENGGLKSKCIIFFPFENFLSVSLCLYVCESGYLSIVFPCVAKQPCVCTLKWGWKREGKHRVNGDRRSHALLHLIEHTSAPDEWDWPRSLWLTVDINCWS